MYPKFPTRGNGSSTGCHKYPSIKTSTSVLLPGRTLAVIHVNSELKPEQTGQVYEVQPNEVLSEKYPNIYCTDDT